jgi:AbiV family abortive infection protein
MTGRVKNETQSSMTKDNSRHKVASYMERVRCYADGAALIFQNAEALYGEAQLLGEAGHFARAAVLHQISMEECSKIDALGAAATSILTGHEVDETRLARAFRNHKAKNYANAYFARATDEEMAARGHGDWKAASEAFKEFQEKFHSEVNTIKNAGLYVGFKDGQFTAPLNEVDESTAIAFQRVNAQFLQSCDSLLRLLRRMVLEPNFYAELAKTIVERSEALRKLEGFDPEQTVDALMKELHATIKKDGGN